jgi:hypothetical protein
MRYKSPLVCFDKLTWVLLEYVIMINYLPGLPPGGSMGTRYVLLLALCEKLENY